MSRGITRNELIDEHEKVVQALKAEIALYRQTLEWYAEPSNWCDGGFRGWYRAKKVLYKIRITGEKADAKL